MTVAMLQHQFKLETTKTSTKITEEYFLSNLGDQDNNRYKENCHCSLFIPGAITMGTQEEQKHGTKRIKTRQKKHLSTGSWSKGPPRLEKSDYPSYQEE